MKLLVKSPYDMLYLVPSVLKLIQGWQDGNLLEGLQYVVQQKLLYIKELNKGEQGTEYEALARF